MLMKKKHFCQFIFLGTIFWTSITLGQDPRDKFIGVYRCKKRVVLNSTIDSEYVKVYVSKDTNVSRLLMVDSTNYWASPMTLFTDSTFKNLAQGCGPPPCERGRFYPNDSIYIYRWGMTTQNFYYEYFGRKISGTIGVSLNTLNQSWRFYPNPVKEFEYILLKDFSPGKLKIHAISISGSRNYYLEKNLQNPEVPIEIDVGSWSNEVYIVKIISKEKVIYSKIVKIQ